MDAIQARSAAQLRYLDPSKSLQVLSAHRAVSSAIGAPRALVDYRSRESEVLRFSFQAAFFSYCTMDFEGAEGFAFAPWPDQQSDIDCIFRRRSAGGGYAYEAVQLKEWPPSEANKAASLEGLLEALAGRYADNADLRVGIYVNRDAAIAVRDMPIPTLRVASLWLYGIGAERGMGAFICGDLLSGARVPREVGLPRLPSSLTGLPRDVYAD